MSDDPGGIRSSSGSAALRRAATPPWTPCSFQSSATPSECPTTQGGFAAHPAPLRSAGLLLPPGPPCLFQSSSTPTECPTTQGGFAAHPAPLRSAGLLLPPGPPSFSSHF